MRVIQIGPVIPGPPITPGTHPVLSDDECLARLAKAVEQPDVDRLEEVAWLIGRLAVPIE